MANPFSPATKKRAKLRLALMGASGSGKTFSALGIASAFGKVAVIDTEHGSASKYADRFAFDALELSNYHPQRYIDALEAAASAGYDVVIVDSLSHAWNGIGGVLEIVDKVAAKSDAKNTYTAWRDATPLQQKLVEAMLTVPMHVIVTMRSKTEYVLELDKRGKMSPRKVGTAPVQRDGIEFEFDIVGEMNADNELVVTKTRISALANEVIPQPGAALGNTLLAWLQDGVQAPPQPPRAEQPPQPPPTSSTNGTGGASPDKLAAAFPAASKWTAGELYEATHDYFNAPAHFESHMDKHAAEYSGLTLEEAKSLVRALHWNYDKAQCDKLAAFGKDSLGMTGNEILAALAEANGHGVKRWKDWDGGNFVIAQGALLAWSGGYDFQGITNAGLNMGLPEAVIDAAQDFGNKYRSELAAKMEKVQA